VEAAIAQHSGDERLCDFFSWIGKKSGEELTLRQVVQSRWAKKHGCLKEMATSLIQKQAHLQISNQTLSRKTGYTVITMTAQLNHSVSDKALNVNSFLSELSVEVMRIEGALRVLQRSIWDVEQDLPTERWGNDDLAQLLIDRVRMLQDQIEHYQKV
jgi:hypothetical protein